MMHSSGGKKKWGKEGGRKKTEKGDGEAALLLVGTGRKQRGESEGASE